MHIEKDLVSALRAQDPGPDFTKAVLARVARPSAPAVRPASRWRLPMSLAASVLVMTFGAWLVDRQLQQQRNVAAGEQLAMALAITSAQLNNVQQKISRNADPEDGI
jgi:ABC-type nickel/cobalt efflux system permease component RcnA